MRRIECVGNAVGRIQERLDKVLCVRLRVRCMQILPM